VSKYILKMPTLVRSRNKTVGWGDTFSQDREQVSNLPAEFCQESSLHGLRFIGNPSRHPIEK